MSQVLPLLLFCASMLGYILFISDRFHYEIEITPLLTILFQIIILFIAALLNVLPFAAYGLFALGLFLLAASLVLNRSNLARFLLRSFRPGMVLFWLAVLYFALLIPQLAYTNWDEFSHWGLIYKLLNITDRLPDSFSALIFPDYPPGIALYEYIVAKILGASEGSSYLAMNLVILSSLMVLLRGISWRNSYRAVMAFAFGFIWLYAVGYQVNLLQVDAALGLIFAAGVIFATDHDKINWSTAVPVILVAAVLPTIKQTGLFFGLGVAGIYAVLMLVRRKSDILAAFRPGERPLLLNVSGALRKIPRKQTLILFLVLISSLTLYKTWEIHLAQIQIDRSFRQDFTLQEVINQFHPEPLPHVNITVQTFIQGVIRRPLGDSHMSTLPLIGLFFGIGLFGGLIFYKKDSHEQKQILTKYVLITGWVGLYMLVLLLAYLMSFNPLEAVITAGFERYMGSAIIGWGLIVYDDVQRFPLRLRIIPIRIQKVVMGGTTLLTILLLAFLIRVSLAHSFPEFPSDRREVQKIAATFSTEMAPDSQVYHIWQRIIGYQHFMMRYELTPRITQFLDWSMGAPYSDEDKWTAQVTDEKWFSDLLRDGYDYVLVSKADDRFWNDYGSLFHNYDRADIPQLFLVTPEELERIK